MKVLVAGATSVLGGPVVDRLLGAGHDVVAVTRSPAQAERLTACGATGVVLDVFDGPAVHAVLARHRPDAMVSLLIALPRSGPRRLRDFDESIDLWTRAVPGLVSAAARSGVRRFVAESMVFAYGYDRFPGVLTEDDPCPGPPPLGAAGEPMIAAMRAMERTVLDAGGDMTGTVLRYGVFHGDGVPHSRYLTRLTKWCAMPAPTGRAVLPWVELGDAADATALAVDRDGPSRLLNVVDDEHIDFRDYLSTLAASLHRPRPLPLPRSVLRLVAPYAALAFGDVELRVSNAAAADALGWRPRYRTCASVFADR